MRGKSICDWDCFHCPYPDCIRDDRDKPDGMCSHCGCRPVIPGRTSCAVCRDKINSRVRKAKEERRAKGLCTKCGKVPASPGHDTCESCAEKSRIAGRKRREAKRNAVSAS